MKPLMQYCPETLESAEEMLANAANYGDRKQEEFFADCVGDDSIEISRLLLMMFKASVSHDEGDLVAAILALQDRMLANACEGFDAGVLS